METHGRHLLVEYRGCCHSFLDDMEAIQASMENAAKAADVTIVRSLFHRFMPHGVSGVVVIEESHLSIHTWPEHGYAAVDFYTCGDGIPERAMEVLRQGLQATRWEMITVERGLNTPNGQMQIVRSQDRGEITHIEQPVDLHTHNGHNGHNGHTSHSGIQPLGGASRPVEIDAER